MEAVVFIVTTIAATRLLQPVKTHAGRGAIGKCSGRPTVT
jgi:hypothetical protein